MTDRYDLVVIGGGSAGLVAAGGAGLIGARVALIEKNRLGGDCLYTGCVPSKSLIRSAKFASDLKRAREFGFEIGAAGFAGGRFSAVTDQVRRVIEAIEPHDSPERFEELGAEVIFGSPSFIGPNEVSVSLADGGNRVLRAKRFCIATGSSPAIPPIKGLMETGFITNEKVFGLQDLPARLIVLGGGPVGVELGQAFARLGSKVTIVEMAPRILTKEDDDVAASVEERLRSEGIDVRTGVEAVRSEKSKSGKTIRLDDGNSIIGDEILVATGRRANVVGLDLEKAGVRCNSRRIETDAYLRSTAHHIYAAGDVTGHLQFTHTADYEAQIVLNNAFLFWPLRKKIDLAAVPWAIFTDPEVARVGMTEREARTAFGNVEVIVTKLEENDRAQTEREIDGFAKIVLNRGKIVGAHIVGHRAGELIHEFVLAMKFRLSLADLNKAIHVYPTLSKVTQAAATELTMDQFRSPTTRKWLSRYLRLWRKAS